MTFEHWFQELRENAKVRGYDWEMFDPVDWADFWADGYSPKDALDEDELND